MGPRTRLEGRLLEKPSMAFSVVGAGCIPTTGVVPGRVVILSPGLGARPGCKGVELPGRLITYHLSPTLLVVFG
jgi:hypothetical protein